MRAISWTGACRAYIFALTLMASCLAFSGIPSQAQTRHPAKANDYALIYGTIWGPDNQPVAGVPVKIRRASDKKPKWELVSDRSGEFAQRVPVGTQDYIVQADIKVPKGEAKPHVTVHIDNNERADISLHLTEQQLSRK